MAEDVVGKIQIGYAPGIVVIDVQASEGQAIMTQLHSEEDVRTIIQTLEECATLAFARKIH